jgi:phosphoadenosine phosphosulfate reductase
MSTALLDLQHDAFTAKCDALDRAVSYASSDRDPMKRVATVRDLVRGRIVFTTSFGLEDQAIAETYKLWAQTERQYGRRIAAFYPDRVGVESLVARQGIDGFYSSVEARRACCAMRKVEPLQRALAGATAWITGLRADQSDERAGVSFAAVDPPHRLIKVSPLFDWTRAQVLSFIREHDIPFSRLHEHGFASIGCAPCTRAIAPGEPERAGRWWWEQEQKKECGLHRPRHPQTPAVAPPKHSPEGATS